MEDDKNGRIKRTRGKGGNGTNGTPKDKEPKENEDPRTPSIPAYLKDLNLTYMQYLFAMNFVDTENGAKSARLAGYSERGAAVAAHANLNKPNVLEALQRIRLRRVSDVQMKAERIKIKQENVLKHLACIAFFDPEWIYEPVEGEEIFTKTVFDTDLEKTVTRSFVRKIHNPIKPIGEWPEEARLALKNLKVGVEGRISEVQFYDRMDAIRLVGAWLGGMFDRGRGSDEDIQERAQKLKEIVMQISESVPTGVR